MIEVICTILLAIDAGGINVLTKADTKGVILEENSSKYLVDFSKGVKKYKLAGKPEDYSEVLVNKNECIVLKGNK